MTRASWLFTHLTARGAWSWPTVLVVLALNVALVTVSVYGSRADWGQRLLAIMTATLVMFSVVGVGSVLESRMAPTWRRGALALIVFALAGASRGAGVAAIFVLWGVGGGDGEGLRVIGGIALGLAVLTPMSLFIGEAREFSAARALLLGRRDQLARSVEQVVTQIGERDEAVLQRIRGAIARAMSSGQQTEVSATESADALDSIALDVIRPLSHQLARAVPSVELPVSQVAPPRISWRVIADAACRGTPFLPVGTGLLIGLLSLPSLAAIVGAAWAAIYVLIALPLLAAILHLANAALAKLLDRRTLGVRIGMVVVVAVIAGITAGLIAQAIFVLTAPVAGISDASSPFAVTAIFVPVLALPLAAARGTFIVHRQTLDQLGEVDVALSRRLARLRQVQWSQQRVLARALHGPVQTLVVTGAQRLRDASDGDRAAQAQSLQRDLLTVLEGSSSVDDRVSWAEGMQRIEATWAGVAHVECAVTPDALELLQGDRVASDVMMEILGEGVANAVRHGDATRIRANVLAEGADLCFAVTDDGCRGLRSGAGMGSRLLDDCCLWWERVELADGVRLTGRMPGPAAVAWVHAVLEGA